MLIALDWCLGGVTTWGNSGTTLFAPDGVPRFWVRWEVVLGGGCGWHSQGR